MAESAPTALAVPLRKEARVFDSLLAPAGFAVAFALGTIAACRLLSVNRWPIELSYHFIPYLAVAALAQAALCGLRRHYTAAVLCAVVGAHFAAVTLAPLDTPCQSVPRFGEAGTAAASAGTQGAAISLITYNVHFGLMPNAWTRKWLDSRPADIIALQEVSRPLAEELRKPSAGYPYRVVLDSGGDGIGSVGLLSSVPILEHRLFRPADDAWPTIIARLAYGNGREGWIVVLHARNPITPFGSALRTVLFETLAGPLAGLEGPVVVVGDFNATPYTPVLRTFVRAAGLTSACRFQGSYPAPARGLGLPIDHVLVRNARITGLGTGRWLGSDHRAIRAELDLQ
ncbi:MAG: endonuclease/exonuclease/phosphatase family protein [Defluviicoccus sp.]